MKQVKLSHFFKKLASLGVDMMGCKLSDKRSSYEFIGMDGNNVKVRYGKNMDRTGHMSAWLRVDSVTWVPATGNRVSSIQGGPRSIVIRFSDMTRGTW